MIPEKIYVREYQDGYYSTCWDEKPHVLAHELESIGMKTVCYIRKNALIEWAKGQKKDCERVIREHPEDESLWCERDKYDELIDKLNSM